MSPDDEMTQHASTNSDSQVTDEELELEGNEFEGEELDGGGDEGDQKQGDEKASPDPDADAESAVEKFFENVDDEEGGGEDEDEGDDQQAETGLTPQEAIAASTMGLTQEEAEKAKKDSPELFNKLIGSKASTIADDTQELLSQAAGSGGEGGTKEGDGKGNQKQNQQDADDAEALMRQIYGGEKGLQKLKDQMGDDVTEIVKPIIEHLAQELGPLRQEHQARAAEQVRQTAESFFNGLPENFQSFYGTDSKRMTPEQVEHRNMLAEQADEIRMAAMSVRGVDMGVQEALVRAHEIVSSKFATELARDELKQQLRQRSSGRTHRPSSRNQEQGGGSNRSDKAAISAVEAKMREMGVA